MDERDFAVGFRRQAVFGRRYGKWGYRGSDGGLRAGGWQVGRGDLHAGKSLVEQEQNQQHDDKGGENAAERADGHDGEVEGGDNQQDDLRVCGNMQRGHDVGEQAVDKADRLHDQAGEEEQGKYDEVDGVVQGGFLFCCVALST